MKKFVTLVILIVCALQGAWAQQYVFISNETNGYFIDNTAKATQTFTEATCVWTASGTLNNTNNRTLVCDGKYLDGTDNNSGTVKIGSTRNAYWRANSNNLCYYRSVNRQVYRDGTNVRWNGSTNSFRVYTSYTKTDEAFTVGPITGVNDVLTTTGTHNLSSAASYTPEYYKYTGPDTRYYASGVTTGAIVATSAANAGITAKTSGFTSDTWSITPSVEGVSINNNGRLSYTTQVTNDVQITIKHTVTENGKTKSAEKTILLYGTTIAAPTITRTGNSVALSTTSLNSTIYYTIDGTTPTASSTPYTSPIDLTSLTLPVTIKAIAIRNGNLSTVSNSTYEKLKCAQPVISIASNGDVTITAESGTTIYYTTNGDAPTTSSSPYSASFNVTNETTVKAIAVKSNWDNSPVASAQYILSGVSGGKVILNDYEDHNWSYYSDPDSPIKSLYPRNVKITYYGYGTNTMTTNNNDPGTTNMTNVASTAVGVSMYESENTFVYYKTLERYVPITNLVEGTPQNIYPYDLIPNPFSKRPTYGTNADTKWRGFYGWRVKSISNGKIYSNVNKTGEIATGTILTTEYQKLYFLPDDAGATNANNATSMTVEFEAVWARAYRVTCNANAVNTNISSGTFQTVSYERNFLVINTGNTGNTNISNTDQKPVTVMMVEPDGSSDYRASTRYINPAYVIAQNNLKFEWMNMQVSNTLSANAKNLVVGRGVKAASGANNDNLGDMARTSASPNPTNTAAAVRGLAGTTTNDNTDYTSSVDYYLRLESGVYTNIFYVSSDGGNTNHHCRGRVTNTATCHATGFFGNDYDRAKNDNNRLVAKEAVLEGTRYGFGNTSSALRETMMLTVKSGTMGTNYNNEIYNSTYEPSPTNAFYTAVGSSALACGLRRTNIEGGSIHCLTGGMEVWDGTHTDKAYNSNKLITDIRIRYNALIRSAAFGGPANAAHYGLRRMVYTGGQVNGWVAGACNGNSDNGGQLYGTTQVYVGGNAKIGDASHTITVNGSAGGNVFGAGRGRSSSVTTGEVAYGTNVVIADNAVVLQNVYGGGDLGYALETANVHVLGGEVKGSVFGGANQKKGVNANVVVRGGLIRGGVYGGCNTSGTLSDNVTIQINGGQIGTSTTPANVHGGGYGQHTLVTGNVDITIGTRNTTTGETAGSAVVYGDVYGGSALGDVNGESTSTTKHTNVTLNGGDVYGAVYGGGLGDGSNAANVYAPVNVTINGGSATNVFGCNNTNGRPMSTVNVNMTGGLVRECVYGGGNAAGYTGTPHVAISGGEVDKHVFGGGLGANAVVTGSTDVKVTEAAGSTTLIKGNVYGGGNAAEVTGNTNVQIGEE